LSNWQTPLMKTYLGPEQVKLLEEAATCFRDCLLISLLFHTGCRISEALALKVEDMDFEQGIQTSHTIKEVLNLAKMELDAIKNELGKRSIPYGGGFVVGHGRRKRLLRQYFPGVPGTVLDVKWRAYKDFVEELAPIVGEIDECLHTFGYNEVKQMAIAEKISIWEEVRIITP